MRLIQLEDEDGQIRVGVVDDAGQRVRLLDGVASTWELAVRAIDAGRSLESLAESIAGTAVARLPATARGRAGAHAAASSRSGALPGLGNRSDAPGQRGGARCHASEAASAGRAGRAHRFHAHVPVGRRGRKSRSRCMRACSRSGSTRARAASSRIPAARWIRRDFALDGGEEPELVGLYVIGPDGTPHRLGFALGNEFSDHVTERSNYLYLAHSKLRACAVGPGDPHRRCAARPARHQPHPARWRGAVGKAVPDRRGQHVPYAGEPGIPPFQVRRAPASRRRAPALLRHRDDQLRRWHRVRRTAMFSRSTCRRWARRCAIRCARPPPALRRAACAGSSAQRTGKLRTTGGSHGQDKGLDCDAVRGGAGRLLWR